MAAPAETTAVPAAEPTSTTQAKPVESGAATVAGETSATAPTKATSNTPPSRLDTGAATAPAIEKYEADDGIDDVNPLDFQGDVATNNELPSEATLRKIENYMLLDRTGKTHSFKSLYSGPNSARRVLIIFVRHFFCGNCQEYLRSLAASITPDALLRLPISTFIAVVGCGDPGLIDMYAEATDCQFPVYADPTRKLYDELGMVKSLAPGAKPAYMKKSMLSSAFQSIFQGLKQVKKGLALKGGDQRQIGGEFLFEPLSVMTPSDELDRQLHRNANSTVGRATPANHANGVEGAVANGAGANGAARATASPPPEAGQIETPGGDGPLTNGFDAADGDRDDSQPILEEKTVTWCHRMRTTRDHAEIPELMEILGLDGDGQPIKDKKRWSAAVRQRKGTGASMASQMNSMRAEAGGT